ncbi:MAG: DUF6797 domain-containing protein [Planctomycetota bacterium]
MFPHAFPRPMHRITLLSAVCLLLIAALTNRVTAETLRHPAPLETQIKATGTSELVRQIKKRGDPRRGARVFFTSPAGCVKCHAGDAQSLPLGPELSKLNPKPTAESIVESLLYPSREIRKDYRTVKVLLANGDVIRGMPVRETDQDYVLRDLTNLTKEITLNQDNIEEILADKVSLMPEGLIATLPELRDFYDLASYLIEIANEGPERAAELQPTPDQLIVQDDTLNLDHAGILLRLKTRDFEAGKKIYNGYCYSCHGTDGETPSLPTARAFGSQTLKFGADPYAMFMTLSRGNGLMAAMTHLTPKERYQVVHYVREQFMKNRNPGYKKVDDEYLQQLPRGSDLGDSIPIIERDYGPAFGSQLERRVRSALTIRAGDLSIAYNLHNLDIASVWRGGLELGQTQHQRDRGEGTADPAGNPIEEWSTWRWGHDGVLDYPTEGILPRGPLPRELVDYRGYHLHGDRVVLRYSIDGREVLESPEAFDNVLAHTLRLGPGKALTLAVGAAPQRDHQIDPEGQTFPASSPIALTNIDASHDLARYFAATVRGDAAGMRWRIDGENRLILEIPQADQPRVIQVVRGVGDDRATMVRFRDAARNDRYPPLTDPNEFVTGGSVLWPQTIDTVGITGLEQGAYRMDTLTLPDQTPWNSWFRTSALDFFPDGRMAVSTYGGDVWIVTGVDEDLTRLTWKRFAAGLYEPFGLKVVDEKILVTCKDRITRLHDSNGDGEADFYESIIGDPDVSPNFHAFNFDLQVDEEGNLYYAKAGHGGDYDVPGAILKISPDGRQSEVIATGFRSPNGMGILPDGRVTVSDNQGQWVPASKINVINQGGFYGWVQTYEKKGMWSPGGGSIDIKKVVPPKSFDPPLVWMPQEFDNSSGGQLFVKDRRWGPLSGRLLHTSFGKGWMSYTMHQRVGSVDQAAIIKLPFDFRTGIMRARVNPADGQVYATGLQGWNGGGRTGLLDGGIQRLVYTSKPDRFVTDCQVEPDGLRFKFNFPLDQESANALSSYRLQHWNYRWRAEYGSDFYSPTTGEVGKEDLVVDSVEVGEDGRSVKLRIPTLRTVHQLHAILSLQDQTGLAFDEEVYWTINAIPQR